MRSDVYELFAMYHSHVFRMHGNLHKVRPRESGYARVNQIRHSNVEKVLDICTADREYFLHAFLMKFWWKPMDMHTRTRAQTTRRYSLFAFPLIKLSVNNACNEITLTWFNTSVSSDFRIHGIILLYVHTYTHIHASTHRRAALSFFTLTFWNLHRRDASYVLALRDEITSKHSVLVGNFSRGNTCGCVKRSIKKKKKKSRW